MDVVELAIRKCAQLNNRIKFYPSPVAPSDVFDTAFSLMALPIPAPVTFSDFVIRISQLPAHILAIVNIHRMDQRNNSAKS